MKSLFNLEPLAQQAPPLPAQPQVGNATGARAAGRRHRHGHAVRRRSPSSAVSRSASSPTRPCASAAKRAKWPAKSGTSCRPSWTPQHFRLSGNSYDNTMELSATSFRHVKFIEQFDLNDPNRVGGRWMMMSDVCKHCVQAGCLEVCPTGAITRTEFDTVYIQQDVCNGCRYCVAGCPFGVIQMNEQGVAGKCTFCYDRLQAGLTPACAQACPTASIQFGPISELQQRADARLQVLQQAGHTQARLYGRDEAILGGLNSFYLIEDTPATFGLPEAPHLPSRNMPGVRRPRSGRRGPGGHRQHARVPQTPHGSEARPMPP